MAVKTAAHRGVMQRMPFAAFVSRPRLVAAIAAGLATGALLMVAPNPLAWSTRAILSWDATCLVLITASLISMSGRVGGDIQARAAKQDEGRHMILGMVLVAVAASLGAIFAELATGKNAHGGAELLRVALVIGTVAASWLVVQIVFALHYAHDYYGDKPGGRRGALKGGLSFPGHEDPDYWDFLHFSIVIGVACQTADICFTSKTLRRIGTVHGVTAFVFNTVVLALTINLLASLV